MNLGVESFQSVGFEQSSRTSHACSWLKFSFMTYIQVEENDSLK